MKTVFSIFFWPLLLLKIFTFIKVDQIVPSSVYNSVIMKNEERKIVEFTKEWTEKKSRLVLSSFYSS